MISTDELLQGAPRFAKKNYERNTRLKKPSGLINGQKKCAVSGHRLGIMKMSFNGCAPIAVYNALLSSGNPEDISAIALGIDRYALKMKGIFGTSPEKIDIFFQKCRIAAIKANDYEDFIRVMRVVRVGILCYWVAKPNRSLLHFAAVINNGGGESFDVCNRYANRRSPSKVTALEQLCSKERYVCGFFLN